MTKFAAARFPCSENRVQAKADIRQ